MTYLFAKRIDGKLYLEIPEEMASRLKIVEGGAVSASDEGVGVNVIPADDRVAAQLAAAERIMEENFWVLSELAK
ncbi:AbrB/MazE/SpoVT family DNA-binding domain-containing protein [Indioceanicola profundi]|uniref:AbrB/MazE/SpoVT family DNA-binding domain-containing protein n=1 Tax=Indioceanicola profundi TaxID=2220096 RepID=UPI000E6AC309|nr:AbrB/MazE/SpoVT family DNA-binding domain-containing protein [Indioceanicola profundi]